MIDVLSVVRATREPDAPTFAEDGGAGKRYRPENWGIGNEWPVVSGMPELRFLPG
jgi:hypothetical protein